MKGYLNLRLFVRLTSLFIVLAVFFLSLFRPMGWMVGIAFSLLCGNAILVFYPISCETGNLSFVFSTLSAILLLASALLSVPGIIPFSCALGVIAVCLASYLAVRTVRKFSCIKALFRHKAVWYSIEEYFRLLCCIACLSGSLLCSHLWNSALPVIWYLPLSVIMLALYVVQYISVYNDRIAFIPPGTENAIRAVVEGDLRTSPDLTANEDARMSALYARIVSYMENNRPFLDDDFDIARFSTIMFTNRTYMSKTINYFSGRNFKQFVNYYRVKYSIDLMKRDPHMSVMEFALMSGFHSVVTYNMAFRINMNDTPANYKKQLMLL